jgi:putative ABC transport system permease protein
MTVWRLVAKEIGYRRLNFALGAFAVLVAVGCLVAVLTLLDGHRLRAEQIGEDLKARTQDIGAGLKDDARRLMLELGYNVLILHKDQGLGEFYAQGRASKLMPETYAEELVASRTLLVRHLLPSLQERIVWPEQDEPIILIGTRGEVPQTHLNPKKPMIAAVPKGTMVLGSVLAQKVGLEVGQKVKLLDRAFTIGKIHERRGNEDDATAWIDLAEAQELLGKPGRINAILALGCLCVTEVPGGVSQQITTILKDTQVVELKREAAIRRATRTAAGNRAGQFVGLEKAGRESLRAERDALATWVILPVVLGCVVWVGLLALGNVRRRRTEIGILRAMGVRAGQILAIFLARALVVGFIGAVVGYAVGFAVAVAWDMREAGGTALGGQAVGAAALFAPVLLVATLVLAPLLSAMASLVPAMMAAQQDPAIVLREE